MRGRGVPVDEIQMNWYMTRRHKHPERDRAMLADRRNGMTFAAIARKHGLKSRTRVREICLIEERTERALEDQRRA